MTPDEHAAEAEQLLVWAEEGRQQDNLDHAAVLAQMATAHHLGGMLASRPTTPDNEPEPSAIHAKRIHELEQERDDVRRSAEEAWSRLHALGNEVDDLRWLVGHLARNAPDTTMLPPRLASRVEGCMDGYDPSRFTLAEPVPSTGEDQAWRRARGVVPAGDEPAEDIIRRARGDNPDPAPEPSTGEDQKDSPGCDAFCCVRPLAHDGPHRPVPDEGSQTNG